MEPDESEKLTYEKVKRLHAAFGVLLCCILMMGIFFSAFLVIPGWEGRMKDTGTVQDFLGVFSVSKGTGIQRGQFWVDVGLLLLLFSIEILLWLALYVFFCVGVILGEIFLFSRLLKNKGAFQAVFGEPRRLTRIPVVSRVLANGMSRIYRDLPE